jgi:hypothetical protein
MMKNYNYGQRWYFDRDAADVESPVLVVVLCLPLSAVRYNRYGCAYLAR